ncbi:MAG: hypothetical protein ACREV3_01825 [Gammaproteobacteria bacterium]
MNKPFGPTVELGLSFFLPGYAGRFGKAIQGAAQGILDFQPEIDDLRHIVPMFSPALSKSE